MTKACGSIRVVLQSRPTRPARGESSSTRIAAQHGLGAASHGDRATLVPGLPATLDRLVPRIRRGRRGAVALQICPGSPRQEGAAGEVQRARTCVDLTEEIVGIEMAAFIASV